MSQTLATYAALDLWNADLSSPVECSHYYHHSLHQWAHKAITLSAQPPLSLAANLATFQLFYPALLLSLSTVLLQVVFGLPLALRPSGMYPNIFPLRSKGAPTVNKKLLSAYSYLTEKAIRMLVSAVLCHIEVFHPNSRQYWCLIGWSWFCAREFQNETSGLK